MAAAIEYLVYGILLGLAQGLSPGPLITLIFSETLKYGRREGLKIAVSPLITDSMIVLFTVLVLSGISAYGFVLGAISLVGACYLIYLGVENLRVRMSKFESGAGKKDSLRRGIIANLLSPHPYLFWLSIGSPTIIQSARTDVAAAILFVAGFYITLIGSKASVALIIGKSKSLVKSRYYGWIIRVLGAALILFALLFIRDALQLLGLY